MGWYAGRTSILAAVALLPGLAPAQPASAPARSPVDVGLVLDAGLASDALALGVRERGLSLGHNELTLGADIGDRLAGRLAAVLHEHEGATELDLEEAFVETTALPAGLQLRAGRFLAALGYLNEQHPHADDFVERPLLHRAFLGGHWFDDGVRLSWVAPTRLYWRSSVEAFSGRGLLPEAPRRRIADTWTLSTRIGGDLGIENGWQLGLSWLHNRLDPAAGGERHHDDDHGHAAAGHEHAHGSRYAGGRMLVADAVWKWAPNGNNRQRQLRLAGEYARVADLHEHARDSDIHEAWYLAAVYRFAAQWEAGLRLDELRVHEAHGEHFHAGRLREAAVSLSWRPSHQSMLRLQWTRQRARQGFETAGNAMFLQYTMSLGAHGAHAF